MQMLVIKRSVHEIEKLAWHADINWSDPAVLRLDLSHDDVSRLKEGHAVFSPATGEQITMHTSVHKVLPC